MQLTPLRDDDLADYLSRRFSETGRKVDEALDLLLDFAAGHPQRAMLIAHYLWEHTDPGETADETSFAAAIEAVHDEVADQLAPLWGGFDDSERRAIAAVAANPAGPLRKETLEPLGLPRATGRDALARLERAGHLLTDGEVVPVHRSTAGPLGGKRPPGADLNGTTVSSPRRQEIIGASAGGLPVLT